MHVKVLIVDDSLFMRRLISDIIKKDPELDLVGSASNGEEAIRLNKTLEPDVILLDVEMPGLNGLETLKCIMEEAPTAVIMFSSLTTEGAETAVKALQLGACDFIPKPESSGFRLDDEISLEIITKLKYGRCMQRKTIKPKKRKEHLSKKAKSFKPVKGDRKFNNLVAIGISTGGPRALKTVLESIPRDIKAPILIVQHMPKFFTKAFAERLDSACEINVKEAENAEFLETGTAYIAPGDFHLRIDEVKGKLKVNISSDEKVSGHRPSVDAMYNSLAKINDMNIVAVIMTGMGRDGAEGMLKLKRNGAKTIAQDEKTSIVYGMPKSAFEIGAVDKICPLGQIAEQIITSVEV